MISFCRKGSLTVSRVLAGSPKKIFGAWTEPAILQKWWGPKDFSCPYCKIDLRPGGEYLLCVQSPAGEQYWSSGIYRDIQQNKRIVVTDSFSDRHGNIRTAGSVGLPLSWPSTLLITVEFRAVGAKTNLLLLHEGIPFEMLSSCEEGWNESLDKLERILDIDIN
jgi:uncharacterized protein YndB with AHSA1/START domain